MALYIGAGQGGEAKKEIFRKVKSAYTIRSRYLHGQTLKTDPDNLSKLKILSNEMDGLLRAILVKAITEDNEYFVISDSDQFIQWIESFVFG